MSRVIAFVDSVDLSPNSAIFLPDFAREMAKQFHFVKVPETIEEFDPAKGIEFLSGRVGKRGISKLAIWNNILVMEARCNTTECKQMLHQIMRWAVEKFDLVFTPDMIRRYGYVSDLSVSSDVPLLAFSPVLEKVARRTAEALSEVWQEHVHYEPMDLKIGHDPLARKWGIAPFQISRKAEHRFTENKYFSEAPLPTDLHIELLEEYEAGVIALQGKAKIH